MKQKLKNRFRVIYNNSEIRIIITTNSIESFWAIIKRQIIGQHHHVTPKYLNNYVQEAVFKYNNRNNDDMFESLISLSMLNLK